MTAPEAERTGEYVVLIYENTGSLLAVHGPYASPDEARAGMAKARPEDRADFYPLWRAGHEGRL